MKSIIKNLDTNKRVSDWRIQHREITEYQMYVIGEKLDTIRKVSSNKYFVTVYNDHDNFRGSTDFTLIDKKTRRLDRILEEALFIASRINNPTYSLPESAKIPFVETYDPSLDQDIENVLFTRLADRLIESVHKEKDVRLSSSEYFITIEKIHLQNSRGLDVTYKTSKIFFDGVLLAGPEGLDNEMHFELRSRRLQDLPIDTIVPRYAQYARDSLSAELPTTGNHPVVVSHDALSGIFSPLVYHMSGESIYKGISQLGTGKKIPGFENVGSETESLTLISNGFIPFGLRTGPVDADGIPAERIELIRQGSFERPWTSQRYADYLDQNPTGNITNIEIPIGPHSTDSLLKDTGPVIQVVAFSAMLPDPVTGNFASEIRLGYEHNGNSVRTVKGGAVSGNLIKCFSDAHYSTEGRFADYALSLNSFGSYIGPEAIRFGGFQVSGS